jgi:hypothetical protein
MVQKTFFFQSPYDGGQGIEMGFGVAVTIQEFPYKEGTFVPEKGH